MVNYNVNISPFTKYYANYILITTVALITMLDIAAKTKTLLISTDPVERCAQLNKRYCLK